MKATIRISWSIDAEIASRLNVKPGEVIEIDVTRQAPEPQAGILNEFWLGDRGDLPIICWDDETVETETETDAGDVTTYLIGQHYLTSLIR